MLVEKLPWCTHEGGVFTVHVQAGGARFATGGADSQVRVWSMAPVLDARKEGSGAPLALATLSDHSSTVNTARFSKNGRWLASGSDDRMICIYEHRPGPSGSTLGGGAANIENWKTKLVLRGHSNNVVDLGWSPDDKLLASCSIDNSVCIWDGTDGRRLHTIDYHTSFVKGLAWDPVGSYLATQSEDKSVAIWRCDDWTCAAKITAPYSKLVTSTFSTRMSWSPDGSFLATGNSYQGSSHAGVVVSRGRWTEDKEHMLVCGHQGCVVSTAFNSRLFRVPKKDGAPGEVEAKLSGIFALGSQDRRITVWATGAGTPLLVAKKFFKSQVTDLAWSPDGYTLLAASSDGTVACLQFAPSELGTPNTQEEMDKIYQELYGSVRGATGGRRLFAESADQLALEAAAADAAASPRSGLGNGLAAMPAAAAAAAAVERALQPSAKHNLDALSARLGGRGGGGGEVQLGFDAPAVGEAPVRKRLATEPMGGAPASRPSSAEQMPPPPPRPSGGQAEAKRMRLEPTPAAGGASGGAPPPTGPASGRGAAPGAPAAAPGSGAVVAAAPHIVLRGPEVPAEVVADLGAPPRLFDNPSTPAAAAAAAGQRRMLRATNRERGGGSRLQAEVSCVEGRATVWTDALRGAAVAACGTHNFAAVGLADGQLMLYSRAGRHLTAPLKLGSGIAKLACDAAWRLLALTTSGAVRLFDVEAMRSLLTASLGPLLEDGQTVLDMRLSRQGVPLVTLSSGRAYAWSAALEGWACVADETFAASQFVPFMNLPGQGEISTLQAEALRAAIPRGQLPAQQIRGAAQQALASRAHLEASLSTALALQSPQEYRRWLLAYARFLTEQGDAGRLEEVCAALLGSLDGGGGGGEGGDADMADGEAAGEAGGSGGGSAAWQPAVLGLPKRVLLRDVLKEMSRNRSLQRTTQTYLDALADVERVSAAAVAAGGAAGQPGGMQLAVA
ncbi:HIRA isoform X1 [Micractinium conductrix]|uniref:Protein HIRA n=1 Tax=Micractinium conductrix TaxID=554055 RepID=A0A2P6VDD3_9CHLO|nr:HIRA isoform X1 [Micractinium conductrix]|eukprot:PSC72094.1 HIRA isoform X1 [Micractinium conductrix]